MREALKNLFGNQITLEDKSQFYYTEKIVELTNMLGNVVAVLQQYSFTKKDDNCGILNCKLYKTTEGNWYYINDEKTVEEKGISRMLKSAIVRGKNSIK